MKCDYDTGNVVLTKLDVENLNINFNDLIEILKQIYVEEIKINLLIPVIEIFNSIKKDMNIKEINKILEKIYKINRELDFYYENENNFELKDIYEEAIDVLGKIKEMLITFEYPKKFRSKHYR